MDNKKLNTLSLLAMLYLVAWCLSPPLFYGSIYRLIAVVAFGILIPYLFYGKTKIGKKTAITLVMLFYIILINLITGDNYGQRLGTCIFLVLSLIFVILERYSLSLKQAQSFLTSVFLLCIIWNICTLIMLNKLPNVMRLLAKNSDTSMAYAQMGVGGYEYAYSLVLLLPVAIDLIIKYHHSWIQKIIVVCFLITSVNVIFKSQYFLAILLAIFEIGLYAICNIRNKNVRLLMVGGLVIGLISFYINIEGILQDLIDVTEVGALNRKLVDLQNMVLNDASIATTDFSTRFERYAMDIRYIVTHPILGGLSYRVTGNHSHILDFVAQYGIPVSLIYFNIIYKRIDKNIMACSVAVIGTTLILLTLNTLAYSFGTILYIIMPVYSYLIKRLKESS